jgi:hypothetical protein
MSTDDPHIITEEEASSQKNKGVNPQLNYYSDEDDDYEDDDNDSVLDEIENEETYFKKKMIYQNRALFRKNLTL